MSAGAFDYTTMPLSNSGSTVLTITQDKNGLILTGTIDAGTPPVTASLFSPGSRITDSTTGIQWVNSGTTAAPVWTQQTLTVVVNLTSANILAMFATPVLIIPAVVGKSIVLDSLDFDITRTATAYANGGVVDLQYDLTANGAGTTLHADIAAAVITGAAGTTHSNRIPKDQSDIAAASVQGIAVYISNKTAAFITGTGTAVVTAKYHLV